MPGVTRVFSPCMVCKRDEDRLSVRVASTLKTRVTTTIPWNSRNRANYGAAFSSSRWAKMSLTDLPSQSAGRGMPSTWQAVANVS